MENKNLVDEFLNNQETSKFVEAIMKQNDYGEIKLPTYMYEPSLKKEWIYSDSKPILVKKETKFKKFKDKFKELRVSIGLKIAGITHDDLI